MMLKYEIKKVLNKRINRALLAAALLLMVVFSIFAIGSFRAVDANGESRTGLSAARIIVADKNRWQGELTPLARRTDAGSHCKKCGKSTGR